MSVNSMLAISHKSETRVFVACAVCGQSLQAALCGQEILVTPCDSCLKGARAATYLDGVEDGYKQGESRFRGREL